MPTPPYMKLYWGDYHRGTRHLRTAQEHGAYLLLIGALWDAGGKLPADDQTLADHALLDLAEWEALRSKILPLFKVSRGRLTHKRVAEELAKYDDTVRKRKMAGKSGGEARARNHSEKGQALAKQKPTKPEPELEPDSQVVLFPAPPEKAESQQRRDASQTRGSRLKPDWTPSADNHAYAANEGFGPDEISRLAEAFRDYWIAATGQKATKLDWSAAWRTWVRNERDRRLSRTAAPQRRADWI